MARGRPLTKNPTLLTALLSVAALAGYVAYRFTLGTAQPDSPAGTADTAMPDLHAHAEPPALADALPEIVLDDLAGTPTPLDTWAGRPLLINFWATWCVPCLREIPLLKTFHEERAGIEVIGIAVDRLDPVLEYADEMQFNYPVLIGQAEGMNAMATFRNDAGAMPFSVFTSADGAVLGTHAGELHPEHLENFAATIDLLAAGELDLAGARERIAGHR